MWIAGRRDSTLFGVVDDTTTTKFVNRACAVHGISLPVVVDKVVVVVLKFPIVDFIAFVDQNTSSLKKVVKIGLVWMTCRQQAYVFICFSIHSGFTLHWIVLNQLFLLNLGSLTEGLEHLTYNPEILISSRSPSTVSHPLVGLVEAILGSNCDKRHGLETAT